MPVNLFTLIYYYNDTTEIKNMFNFDSFKLFICVASFITPVNGVSIGQLFS